MRFSVFGRGLNFEQLLLTTLTLCLRHATSESKLFCFLRRALFQHNLSTNGRSKPLPYQDSKNFCILCLPHVVAKWRAMRKKTFMFFSPARYVARQCRGVPRGNVLARNVCARACAMFAFSEQANLRFWLAEIWFLPPLLAAQQEVASKCRTPNARGLPRRVRA